ncbi:hypothetical protein I3843_07G060100 [Carya illinoinensis]|nr:hypothetical protein I3843_07G060100 [Carya illinoinensis]
MASRVAIFIFVQKFEYMCNLLDFSCEKCVVGLGDKMIVTSTTHSASKCRWLEIQEETGCKMVASNHIGLAAPLCCTIMFFILRIFDVVNLVLDFCKFSQ